jgi:hypothetical protein
VDRLQAIETQLAQILERLEAVENRTNIIWDDQIDAANTLKEIKAELKDAAHGIGHGDY